LAKVLWADKSSMRWVFVLGFPASLQPMRNLFTVRSFRTEVRGIPATLLLVALTTAALASLQFETGLTHGSVIYLIPVVVAGMRWGIIPAVIASICGAIAAAFFFYPPLYSFRIKDPQEVLNLALFVFVAVVISHLATRLKQQLELARQREIDMRDLYAFSRRFACAFDVSDMHAAIEDHLTTVMQRKVALFARGNAANGRKAANVPLQVRTVVEEIAAGRRDSASSISVPAAGGEVWLVQAVSPKNLDFGVIAINLGGETLEDADSLRVRV